ncbi:MAG: aromatase/cyclase [bacterium]|nr:aromatase/cyclase [bacterium]
MTYVARNVTIKGEPEKAYALIKEMEDFPKFMPDVQSVEVVRRGENMTVTDWVTEVDGTEIIWTEEDHFDDEHLTVDYKLTEGDLDKFEGQWIVEPTPEGCKVTLTVDFDFGIPELIHLIGGVLEIKVTENSDMMLNSLKTRLEGQQG